MKKILVIRFSSIGDIVLTTPVVRCLKRQVPDAEVHYLTRDSFSEILKPNPYLDKIITIHKNISEVSDELRKEKYDFVIDLHHNLRSALVKASLRCPGASFNKLNIEKWLLVNFKVNLLPKTHIVNRYIETTSSLGVKYDGGGLDFFMPAEHEVSVSELPEPWRNGYVAFAIGAMHFTKRLPEEKIIEIIRKINRPVLLLGGRGDAERSEMILGQSNGLVLDGCGKYNIYQSASLVRQAKAVITHDTGLMHIASAFGKKIISVWGNTVPEFGMYPFLESGKGESVIIENKNLSCRPCSKIGFEKCPKKHFKCMMDLSVENITGQVEKWWDE